MPLTLLPPTLSREEALTRRLEGLAGQWRRTLLVREGCKWLALVVLVALGIALLDQRFALPALVRALALVGFLVGSVLLARRWVLLPFEAVGGVLTVAQRIERTFPEFNDSLLSAVQFLQQPLAMQHGSPSLRQAAIRRALKKAERYDLHSAIPTRGTKRWLFLGLLSVGALVTLVQSFPASANAEWLRLTRPYGGTVALAQTHIAIVAPSANPHRMARGEALDIKVRFTGIIPERATVSLQSDGGTSVEQSYPVPQDIDARAVETVFRVEANRLTKDFQFRIRANDGETEWQRVTVHPPPTLVPRDGRPSPQIRLDFPAYTDRPSLELNDGSGIIDCIAGTHVTIRAATDRPVQRAWIVWQPEHAKATLTPMLAVVGAGSSIAVPGLDRLAREVWQHVPVAITADGQQLDVTFIPRVPGPYVLRFEDETGLGASRTFDVRVKPDPAPEVVLDEPAPSREHLLLPDAEFSWRALIKDEQFAVRRVQLEYRINAHPPQTRPFYDAEEASQLIPTLARAMSGLVPPLPALRLRFTNLNLGERLRVNAFRKPDGSALHEGDSLFLTVLADDFDDITGFKQPGRSPTVAIQIVGKTDLDAVMQQAQSDLRGELLRLQAQQRAARNAVQDVQRQLHTTGRLRPEDREQLSTAEQLQAQIRARLNSTPDGLRAQLANLKKMAADNRLPRSAATERLNDAAAELDRLAKEELEPLQADLATARTTDDQGPQQNALTRTEKRQKEVEQTLQSLLERLEPWSGAGEIRGETRALIGELRRNLDKAAQLAEKLPPNTPTEQLNPTDKAELDRTALNDDRVAERVRQMIEKLHRLAIEKEAAAQDKRQLATDLHQKAAAAQAQATQAPKGSPEQKNAQQQATDLTSQATAAQAAADDLQREADALRTAAQAGNAEELKEQVRSVGPMTRQNLLNKAATHQKSAVANLERLLTAMENQQTEDVDRLSKSLKKADRELDNLITEQETLQKKIRAAQQIADPMERQAAIEQLARQQAKLEQQTRDLAQKLARAQGDEAAQELRRAARDMAQAREQLEAGDKATKLDDALDRLDEAQAKLDQQQAQNHDALQREQAAKIGDKIKNLRDRQQRLLDEAKRLHNLVVRDKKWERPVRTSLNDLRQQQQSLVPEVRQLIDTDFDKAAVFGRMLRQAADAMELASKRIDARLDTAETGPFDLELEAIADAGIRAQQQLALKRFDQLLHALKPEQQAANPNPPTAPPMPMENPNPPPMPMGQRLPPLAQLKALRELQADIAERTKSFDQAHPDLAKLNDDEVAELEALMKMQVDVAELIKQLTMSTEGALP